MFFVSLGVFLKTRFFILTTKQIFLLKNTEATLNALLGHFLPINKHCQLLSKYFSRGEQVQWINVANWLQVASGIRGIDYDAMQHSTAYALPHKQVQEYVQQKQKLHDELILELVIFNFIYSGLECLLGSLRLPACPHQRGKIASASFFMKENFDNQYVPIKYYIGLGGVLRKLLRKYFGEEYEQYFEETECASISSLALRAIYKLRNHLVHGTFFFPEPEEWSAEKPLDTQIINVSTRLLLLSLQMITMAYCKQNKLPIAFEPIGLNPDKPQERTLIYLNTLHLIDESKQVPAMPDFGNY